MGSVSFVIEFLVISLVCYVRVLHFSSVEKVVSVMGYLLLGQTLSG